MNSGRCEHATPPVERLGAGQTVASKVVALNSTLRDLAPVLVAFSGGVDSTVLLKAAIAELGSEAVLAVTAHGDVHTAEELATARGTASRLGAQHEVVKTNELEVDGFSANPPERCYLCKYALYEKLLEMARARGLKTVADGANSDDGGDYRPGLMAAEVLGVRSPLAEIGLSKAEVRVLAKQWELQEWDRPSSPCLASRFPYGEPITATGLEMVAGAERYLRGLGLETVRVRHHGNLARIEVSVDDIPRLILSVDDTVGVERSVRHNVVGHLRKLGYAYVALDMQGFRSGSLNEALQLAAVAEEEE
jgi:uncharacterized protein